MLDSFSLYAKAVIYLAAAIALVLAGHYLQTERLARFEYPVLILLATLGMSVMVSAGDLIALYLGLELQSLALYILAAFNRDSLRASEAGLKYFVLGALSSGLLLYGASLVYGFAGSTDFNAIALAAEAPSIGLIFGMVFVVSGLAFKISAAPFHMWTPDVYEGAPTPVTAFFATAPKLAAMVLLIRVLMEPFGAMADQWQRDHDCGSPSFRWPSARSVRSCKTNIKPPDGLIPRSAMSAYALVGLSAGSEAAVWAVLLYMTLYVIGVAGAFGVILSMRRAEGMVERIEDLAGLSRNRPGLALAFTGLLLSIGGMPFLVGFFGKLFVFYAAVQAGLVWLVVIAGVFSAVSIAYYLMVLKRVWFDEPTGGEFINPPASVAVITRVTGIATVGLLLVVPFMLNRVIEAGSAIGG